MKKIFLILNSAFLILNSSFAQPAIQWQKCLGGTKQDVARSIQQTNDGGYIIAGSTSSTDGDVSGNHGLTDGWVIKLDGSGNLQWQKCLGGAGPDNINSACQTSDGGFVVAGYTSSNDGDVTGNHGNNDLWVVKLNNSGVLQWQKCFGGTGDETAFSVLQTTDGGFVAGGYTSSTNGDVTGNHGSSDLWIVKLNNSGVLQWQKCLGGTSSEDAHYIFQTVDGGFIVSGGTDSNDGDVTGNHGALDYWVIKLDSSGTLQWQKCFGGTNTDHPICIQQTADGGFAVAGVTNSTDGDISGNNGSYDYWIIKLDSLGNLDWQKCLGGSIYDEPWSILQTSNGDFITAGQSFSVDGEVTGNNGNGDLWLVDQDTSGTIQWQKCYGGTGEDAPRSIRQTVDGGFIVAGYSGSNDGDVTGNHGGISDLWAVKLSAYVGIEEENNNVTFIIFPNPFTTQATITFNKEVHNATFSLFNLLGGKEAETSGINGESFQFNRGNLQSSVYVFEVTEKGKNIGRGKAVVY